MGESVESKSFLQRNKKAIGLVALAVLFVLYLQGHLNLEVGNTNVAPMFFIILIVVIIVLALKLGRTRRKQAYV